MSADGSRRPDGGPDEVVVRKVDHGWVVGDENVSDLTSAMVLADLFAADHATGHDTRRKVADAQTAPAVRNTAARNTAVRNTAGRNHAKEVDEAARLAVTVTQLEHALASRVRVEQAIGVLAERHRLPPREAFDLLRGAARSQGRRVTEIAQDVVASAANPLLRLPAELASTLPEPRLRALAAPRAARRAVLSPRGAEQF